MLIYLYFSTTGSQVSLRSTKSGMTLVVDEDAGHDEDELVMAADNLEENLEGDLEEEEGEGEEGEEGEEGDEQEEDEGEGDDEEEGDKEEEEEEKNEDEDEDKRDEEEGGEDDGDE